MESVYYNPKEEKGSCVVRAISKALNKNFDNVKLDLIKINENYNDDKVFDIYLANKNFLIDETNKDKLFKNYNYDGINILFAYCDDWYHMFTIIDNIIYDKYDFEDLENMKIIKLYKKQ